MTPDFTRPVHERWRAINIDQNAELHRQGRAGYGWVSVNRYSAVCLNANRVFFGDVDAMDDPHFKKKIPRFHSREEAFDRATAVAKARGLVFRLYHTYAGVRLIELSRLHDPGSLRTYETLDELGCDLSFIKLTKKQLCFRARLTPKPWRAEPRTVHFRWKDVDVNHYLKDRRWRISDYICTIGAPEDYLSKVIPEIAFIVEFHDMYCSGNENQPLV